MEAISKYNKERLMCLDFIEQLEDSVTASRLAASDSIILSFMLPVNIALGIQDYLQTQKLIKKIRVIFNECSNVCNSTHAEAACLTIFTELAILIRDNYIRILENVSRHTLPSIFFKAITKKSLADWDDLVEDCVIGNDPEIRELIYKISEAA